MTHIKTMEAANIMENMDTTATNTVTVVEEDAAYKKWELAQRLWWSSY